MTPTRLQATWGQECLRISSGIMLSTYLVLNEYMLVGWFTDWKITFFLGYCPYVKGVIMIPWKIKADSERQSWTPGQTPPPQLQGSMERKDVSDTISVLTREKAWPETGQTCSWGDIKHKWVPPQHTHLQFILENQLLQILFLSLIQWMEVSLRK